MSPIWQQLGRCDITYLLRGEPALKWFALMFTLTGVLTPLALNKMKPVSLAARGLI